MTDFVSSFHFPMGWVQDGGFASTAIHPLSRASPRTARKVICLFIDFAPVEHQRFIANSSTLLEGIKTVRSGQGMIPFKSGVGIRGVPQGRNLFEPRGLRIHSARPGP